MATIRLVPSSYSVSNTSYLSVTNPTNMYNNTDNTTYARAYNSRTGTTAYYLYINGFNFDDVPSNATVNSVTVKIKGYESGLNTSNSLYLVNNTTTLSYTASQFSTSSSTITFSSCPDWDTLSGYGSNFGIRVNCARASRNTAGYAYIYGAEILVDYTINHTITSTITNGTITSTNPATVAEGSDATITFTANTDYEIDTMTVNGSSVTPTLSSGVYSYTISSVAEDETVVIVCKESDKEAQYAKVNGNWLEIETVYKKVDGKWVEDTFTYDSSKPLVYLGNIVTEDEVNIIGTVDSSTNEISLTDTSTLSSGTYTLYYENEDGIIEEYDAIGTMEV